MFEGRLSIIAFYLPPANKYYRGTISTATDVFMLATTWLNVDTGTDLDTLAEKNATDTGSDSYSKILSSDRIKFYEGFKLFDPNSRKFLSRMMEEDGSKRPEIHEVLDFCKALWTDSGIDHPSVRNTELLVPQNSVLHNYYELRKETQWTRVEERPFEYWVLELKAVNPDDLKRIIADNKIFDVHSQLMQNVKPVVEAAKFILVQVKYDGRPASSSALAIYLNGQIGTGKSLCVRADECAKLFDLDISDIKNFLRRHKRQTSSKRNAGCGPNWLISRAMPSTIKETLIECASKILHDIKIPYRHTNYYSWVRLDLVNLFLREYDYFTKLREAK